MHRLALAVFVLAPACVQATPYVFVPSHSQGSLHWNHLGFSNPGAQFSRIEGKLEWNAAEPARSTVMATIPMSALSTGVPDLDEDFRAPTFFYFSKFTVATFTSTRIARGAMADHYAVTGDLTIRGVTKPVTLDATINKIGTNPRNQLPSVGFDAIASLRRSDFGLGRFVPQVSDEIRVALTVEAVDEAANSRYEAAEAAEAAKEAAAAKSPAPAANQH